MGGVQGLRGRGALATLLGRRPVGLRGVLGGERVLFVHRRHWGGGGVLSRGRWGHLGVPKAVPTCIVAWLVRTGGVSPSRGGSGEGAGGGSAHPFIGGSEGGDLGHYGASMSRLVPSVVPHCGRGSCGGRGTTRGRRGSLCTDSCRGSLGRGGRGERSVDCAGSS